MLHFIKHGLLSVWRAGFVKGGWGARIALAILALYFGFLALVLAIFLPDIIDQTRGELSVFDYCARFVLYVVIGDFLFRFTAQGSPKVQLQHYVLLPVPYNTMVRYILGLSFVNLFNLLLLIVLVPLSLNVIAEEQGVFVAIWWNIFLLCILAGNTLLAGHAKRMFANNYKAGLVVIGLVLALAVEEWLTNGALQRISAWVFSFLLTSPITLVMLVYPVIAYRISKTYLLKNRYAEHWRVNSEESNLWSRLDWQGSGKLSQLIANEWKLIIRHKRTRSALLFSLFFLTYGLFMYNDVESSSPANLFVAFFMVSFGVINYGQYLIAWEARYFDGLMVRPQSFTDYFNAKWRLMGLLIWAPYLLSLLYGFINVRYLILHTIAALYSVGVNNYIILFFATYQRKSIDLNAGSAFNYQGSSAVQFLMIIPMLVLPLMVYGLIAWPFGERAGWIALTTFSLISLSCHRFWIKGIADNFKEKKHQMADAFRSKE